MFSSLSLHWPRFNSPQGPIALRSKLLSPREIGLIRTNCLPHQWILCPPGCEWNVAQVPLATCRTKSRGLPRSSSQEQQILSSNNSPGTNQPNHGKWAAGGSFSHLVIPGCCGTMGCWLSKELSTSFHSEFPSHCLVGFDLYRLFMWRFFFSCSINRLKSTWN